MKKRTLASLALAALLPAPAFAQAAAAQSSGKVKPDALAPSEIVAAAPAGDWVAIAASDLLVMDLTPDAKGRARRVIIQLMPPPFSQGWIGNIRKLAAAHWWDGTSINRVQDNYVVQWGDASEKKALPGGLVTAGESGYTMPSTQLTTRLRKMIGVLFCDAMCEQKLTVEDASLFSKDDYRVRSDAYATFASFDSGWPLAIDQKSAWPVHCYAMIGVGRNLSPDTGTGAELYTVIGHAPRHLDRNIALVGRVIEGIEHLSSLPRGTEALGFYKTAEERVPIKAIRMATELASNDIPRFEYLSTESASFARYADARANRRDPFFIRPAGGADICNIPVPVRRAK